MLLPDSLDINSLCCPVPFTVTALSQNIPSLILDSDDPTSPSGSECLLSALLYCGEVSRLEERRVYLLDNLAIRFRCRGYLLPLRIVAKGCPTLCGSLPAR